MLRKRALALLLKPAFDEAILVAIVVSTVHLAVEGPPDADYLADEAISAGGSLAVCEYCWIARAALQVCDALFAPRCWTDLEHAPHHVLTKERIEY